MNFKMVFAILYTILYTYYIFVKKKNIFYQNNHPTTNAVMII